MANSVNDGLFLIFTDGVLSPVARKVTEAEAKADAEARTLSTGSPHAYYKAVALYNLVQTPSVEETVL